MKQKNIIKVILTLFFILFISYAQVFEECSNILSTGGGLSTGNTYTNFSVLGEPIVNSNLRYGNYHTDIGFIYRDNNTEQYVTLISPNGGETWQAGTTKNITWSSQIISKLKIEFTTNCGTDWAIIDTSYSANIGSYPWMVPNSFSDSCKVKISSLDTLLISDESDSVFTISPSTLDKGLVAYYPFNGNANDESGNSHNGTVLGATLSTDRFNENDKAYSFDGVNDAISLGSWFNYQTFSISMWLNPASTQTTWANIIDDNHVYEINWRVEQSQNNINKYSFGASKSSAARFFTLNSDKWQHLVLLKDINIIMVYVDGELIGAAASDRAIS